MTRYLFNLSPSPAPAAAVINATENRNVGVHMRVSGQMLPQLCRVRMVFALCS
jgi:hypothetical protein